MIDDINSWVTTAASYIALFQAGYWIAKKALDAIQNRKSRRKRKRRVR